MIDVATHDEGGEICMIMISRGERMQGLGTLMHAGPGNSLS